jgi:uncharacterized protein YwqG
MEPQPLLAGYTESTGENGADNVMTEPSFEDLKKDYLAHWIEKAKELAATNSKTKTKKREQKPSMNFKKELKPLQKNAVRINCADTPKESRIGSSKIGGKPDLPPDFAWYYYDGKPLSFLAQINCAEAKKYDKDGLLPATGLLYFFYELEDMKWGFDPKDKGSARVYCYQGDLSALIRTDFPADLEEDYQIPPLPVAFSQENNLPAWEEYFGAKANTYEVRGAYDKAKYSLLLGEVFNDSEIEDFDDFAVIHKLLGYANVKQNDMLAQCEMVDNGIYCGGPPDIADEERDKYENNRQNWQLLLQLSTIENSDSEMMWGDCGRIYFYIKKDDLRNLNFDNCWLVLQGG